MSSPVAADGPVVVAETDDHRLLDAVLRACDTGRSCGVLDPRWPAPLLDSAREQVGSAAAALPPGSLVLFTSGSTGRPRAVVRSFSSWLASVDPLSQVTGASPDDVVYLPGPLTSSLFLYGAFHARRLTARVLTATDAASPATLVHVVPSQLRALVGRADAWPALRTVVVAGDRLPASLGARAREHGWRVVEYYGAAELSFVAWRDDDGPMRAFPGARVAVRDGVVWASSPYLSRGYLEGGPGPLRVEAGWATVGDLAREVPGGLEVLGRGGSAVTTGGSTVVAEEVETVLRGVPGVDDVLVVGVPDARLGEVVTAVVVAAEGALTRGDLAAAVSGLPAPARPRRWYRTPALPTAGGGKPDRAATRAAAVAARTDGGAGGLAPLR